MDSVLILTRKQRLRRRRTRTRAASPAEECGAEEAVTDGGWACEGQRLGMGQKEAVGKAPGKGTRAGQDLRRSSFRIRENWGHILALLFH